MKRDSLHLSNLCCCRGGLVLRVLLGSMGTAAGLASTKLYFVMMVLMNDSCDNEMVHASRFLVTFIPNNQLIGPRSVILNRDAILDLNSWISSFELPVIVQLSTCTARMSIFWPMCCQSRASRED